jgi:hypothetical protein
MKIKKSYTQEEVLQGSKIGFEFEFYSNLSIEKTARSIAKYTGKRVVIPLALSNLKNPKPLYHSPVNPTADIFKLEPDYSGGKNMCELVTGPLSYKDARNVLIKVFEWIVQNGYTNDRCSIHANISIDANKIHTLNNIPNINIAKFILDFNEAKVYEIFPDRQDSVYARSIKEIRYNKVMFYGNSIEEFNRSTLTLPADEKYYGVNFLKAEKGYLEYRYMGGDNYQKKTRKILELVDYFIMHMFETLNFNGAYTENDRKKFKKILDEQENVYMGFMKYGEFKKRYPDIEVSIDMKNDEQILQATWGNLRDKLFEIITTGKMKKGKFNYDAEMGRYQLRESKIGYCRVSDVEFIQCEIQGILERCWFYECKIKNSRLTNCEFMKQNTIEFSKISESPLHITNICNDCYIENKKYIINCEMNRGVIRNGEIGKLAKLSKETQKPGMNCPCSFLVLPKHHQVKKTS